jgi:hypothetical protein
VLKVRTLAKGRWSGWTSLRRGAVAASVGSPSAGVVTVLATDTKGTTWKRSRNAHGKWGSWTRA